MIEVTLRFYDQLQIKGTSLSHHPQVTMNTVTE